MKTTKEDKKEPKDVRIKKKGNIAPEKGGGDMTTYVFCIKRSGRMMPEEKMAPADLAVPYEAPMTVKMMAQAHPIAPKNDF